MTSSLLNFIFENFLSSIVEIDTSKTNLSIFSGEIELNNLKIKDEIFQNLNLPFVEVVHGYVGSLKISLQMPFFYDNPIKVFVDKIFFHARLKNINQLKEEDEIKNMEELKKAQLLKTEQILAQVQDVRRQNEESESKKSKDEKKSPGLVQKIINNLSVEINDVVFKFDDEISYPEIPYSICMILDSVIIRSTRNDFKIPENEEESIPYEEINYKVVVVDNFSIYMDCFDTKDELDYERLISNKVTQKIKVELRNYLKDQLGFYTYCMSEIYVHSRKFDSHQYLLHQLDLSVKVALNDNVNNKEPKISAIVGFPQILLSISLKQIRTLLKVVAYLNLSTLYQRGIKREYYQKELNQNEKRSYEDGYLEYFKKKYIDKEKVEFPTALEQIEDHLSYDQISEMRSKALHKLEFILRINDLTRKIQKEEGKLWGKKEEIINKLNEEKNKVMKMEEDFIKGNEEQLANMEKELEPDELKYLDDNYVKIYALVDILITSFTIYETVNKKEDGTWELKDKLLSFVIQHFGVECKIQKVGLIALMSLENIIVSQEKIKNPNYNKIFFGDLTIKGKILCIIFEMNPKLKKSDIRVKVWSERQVYLILDVYTLQYIKYQITEVLATTIDLEEVSSYAKGSVYDYIQEGYQDKVIEGNFNHSNLYLDVSLNCPIIIIPINVFDDNNTKCILLSLGSLKLKSILPPRIDKKLNYEEVKDENIMYDIYRIGLLGIRMATVENCIEKNNYIGNETFLLKDFDFSIECKLLIQPKNPNFHNMIINLLIPQLDFELNEFQILLLIEFLGNMTHEGNKLKYEMEYLKRQEKRLRFEMLKKAEERKMLKLTEKEKKEEEKEREEKIKKKQEELKEKRLNENIKRAKIVYEKVIKSFSMADHSIANYETIKCKSEKKAILVNFIIGKTRFAIRKMFADLSIEDYLVFQIDLIKIEVDIMIDGIMLIGFLIRHIILNDVDKDETKQYYLNPNYICLVESAKEGQMGTYNSMKDQQTKYCFIDLTMLMLGEEMDMTINMNDLHIIMSLNSILRLYQFGMYYLEKYTITNYNVENDRILLEQELKNKMKASGSKEEDKEKNEELIENEIQAEYMARLKKYVRNVYTVEQAKYYIKKRHKTKTLDDYIAYFADVESSEKGKKVFVTSERKRSKMRIIFNMNNTMFKLPINPNSTDDPLFSMYFDLTFTMDATNVYDDVIALPSRKILAQIYETKTSYMHVSLSQCEFDMVYLIPNTKRFTHNVASERLVSNFRFKCNIESYIAPYVEQSIMNIDVEMEPLILAFGMRQFRKIMTFSTTSLEFLSKLEEKYFPFLKPEQIQNGVVVIPKRKRQTMKKIIQKIFVTNQIRKVFKQKLVEMNEREKKKMKVLFINTNRFNSHMNLLCKIDKIGLILFDNTAETKTIMLELNLTKLLVKMKKNSRIKDKENMTLALYEMLTADILPRTKYNLNELGLFIDVLFSMDANYFNIIINDYEPLLERFNMGVTMLQVAPFCKTKAYVTTNDVINFNLSTDGVFALNKFLLTFMQDEKMWKKDNIVNIYAPMLSKSIKKDIQRELEEEIILKFINCTGLDLVFSFDDNPNYKINMKSNGKINFTRINLYKARGHDRYKSPYQKTTFSVSINDSQPIEHINYQRNNYKQYKVNVQNNMGKSYQIYFSVIVESSGITNTVLFCPSISFYNDTLFDTVYLSINNQSILDNTLLITKGKSEYIPLTWIMCDYPESSISIKLSQTGEYTQICNNILEFVVDPTIDEETLNKRNNMKNKVQKAFPDANNPTFIKMVDIKKSEFDNRKNSKNFIVNDNGARKSINFDYFILQSKDFKKIDMKQKQNNETNKNNSNNIEIDNSTGEIYTKNSQVAYYDYEYIIYIRSLVTIANKVPFTLNLECSEGNKIIETLEKESLYDELSNMKISMEYNNNIYTSNTFTLNEENMYIDLNSDSSRSIKCHVFRNPIKLTIPNPKNYYCDLIDYSINSYEYTFFFDYLINNRLTKKIWACPCQKKGLKELKDFEINQRVLELQPSSVNLLSLPDYEPNFSIKDESSPWSDSFNINTVGVNGTIKLNTTNYPVAPGMLGKSTYNGSNGVFQTTNEIACLLSGSNIYDFSVIIVFEPKYIIINNLGFDIVYKQEGFNNMYPLRSKDYHGLMYENAEKDFRIGIKDDSLQIMNYSGIFNLENVLDVDLKIKINKNSSMFNKQMKIFSYDGIEYYILIRVINQSYDQGTVYILLSHPIFPYLEISNETKAPLRVFEEGTNGIVINNPKVKAFPFVWDNSHKHKDELYFEIYGKTKKFNYSIFKEESLKITERETTLLYSVSSKNKTSTRRFLIKEKENLTKLEADELKLYLKGQSRPKSMYFDIFIRGFGISIIDNSPKELFYLSVYNMNIKYIKNVLVTNKGVQSESTMNVIVYIDNMQIDYCLNDSLKTILSPKRQIVPSIEADVRKAAKEENEKIVPFMSVLLTMTKKTNHFKEEQFTAYNQIDFVLQEFDIKVEQYALMNLLKLLTEITTAFDYAQKTQIKDNKEPLLDIEIHIPIKKLMNENENSTMNLIYYLLIGALKFNMTLRLDLSSIPMSLPKTAKRIIGTIGNTLGRITDCPLRFSEKVVENVYLSWPDVSMIIVNSYISQGITQIYKILGSLDIIGNPVKLVKNVGGGLYDFVNEPRKGFRNGPLEFGKGVAKGFGGLLSGVFGGIFDFIQRITGTLYAATQTITGTDRDSMSIEDENEPTNIFSGIGEGCVGFGKEIGKGFYGLCVEPCNKASIHGAAGFCKGFGTGLLRLIVSPFAGLLKLITCIMAGCKNTCYVLTGKKRIRTTRFRHPRVIVEGEQKLLPYEENKAEARECLYQLEKIDTNNIIFAEDFICPDCPRKISTAILTDKYMYVIYNMQKIVFKLELQNVENTNVHYIDDKFILAFKLYNNKTKGFPIRSDYSTVATGLQDILYHTFNKSLIMYSPNGKQGPDLVYDVDELIEKSSYANTLIGEQSIYSDKTLVSKLTYKNNNKRENNQIINHKNKQSFGFENESLKQLNPSFKSNDYIALNVK